MSKQWITLDVLADTFFNTNDLSLLAAQRMVEKDRRDKKLKKKKAQRTDGKKNGGYYYV